MKQHRKQDDKYFNKLDENEIKELKEEIDLLKEGISDEIDRLGDELKKIKKRNVFLEERDKDFQRNFETDKKIFKELQKGRQSNIKRAYEQGKKDMLEEVIKIIDNWYARRLSINDVLEGKTVQKLRESLGEIK